MKKCLDIKLAKYCWDEIDGLKYCVITALDKKTDGEIGTIRYNVFKQTITIDMMEVEKDFRRCGIASRMMKKLEKEHQSCSTIDWEGLSGEGEAFIRKYYKMN